MATATKKPSEERVTCLTKRDLDVPRGGRHHEALTRYLDVMDASKARGPDVWESRAVRDVMSTPVISVWLDTPFEKVAETLATEHVSAVPVLDSESRVRGVVSEADLLAKAVAHTRTRWRDLVRHPVGARTAHLKHRAKTAADLMTTPAVTVRQDASIPRAARLASSRRVKRLPVVDESDRLVGVVSRADMLRIFLRPDEEIREQVFEEVIREHAGTSRSKVSVGVEQGVVKLSGNLERRSMIPMITLGALDVDGVVQVIDDLNYSADDTIVGPMASIRE